MRPSTAGNLPTENEVSNQVREALAKNFAKKLAKKPIVDESKQSNTELRNEFLLHLAKVYVNETKKDGVIACHRLIQRNCDNPQALRIVMGALCDKSTQAQNEKKPQGLMYHVQMFGYLAKCFKIDLKDPLDKPPSMIKTIQRI